MTESSTPKGPIWSRPAAGTPADVPLEAAPTEGPTTPPAFVPPPVSSDPAPLPVTVTPKARVAGLTTILLAGALIVAVGGVAFAVGRVTAPAQTAGARAGLGGANGGFPNASGAPGGNFRGGAGAALGAGGIALQGTVTAVNGQTITLQLSSGQSVTIDLSGTTTYHTATTGSVSDVANGSTVVVQVQGGLGGRNPNGASPNPSGGGTLQFTASDVTVVKQ